MAENFYASRGADLSAVPRRLVRIDSSTGISAIAALFASELVAVLVVLTFRYTLLVYIPTSSKLTAASVIGYFLGSAAVGLYPGRGILGPARIRLRAIIVLITFVPGAFVRLFWESSGMAAALMPILNATLIVLLASFLEIVVVQILSKFRFWQSPAIFVGDHASRHRIEQDLRCFPELGFMIAPAAANEDVVHLATGQTASRAVQQRTPAEAIFWLDVDSPLPKFYCIKSLAFWQKKRENYGSLARFAKRLIDSVGASILLLLFSPIIVVAAAAIFLCDGGPVLFSQTRGGLDGKMFSILKFRTMYKDSEVRLTDMLASDLAARSEWDARFKLANDLRVLPGVGKILRKLSLDELPQLWNVLKGDMSLVGPRPFPVDHLRAFSDEFRNLRARAKPGLSGLWQVTVRSDCDLETQERMDRAYIEEWSLWLDLYVLLRTPIAVLSLRGAM